jgi:hypothetical protein
MGVNHLTAAGTSAQACCMQVQQRVAVYLMLFVSCVETCAAAVMLRGGVGGCQVCGVVVGC